MSVCSDLSMMSVSYRGSEVNLEKQLDETIRGLQKHLNDLQLVFRQIAMSCEQEIGEEVKVDGLCVTCDLINSCKQVDEMKEHIVRMNNLFDDLLDMSDQLVYEPINKDEKAYLKKWKNESKGRFDDLRKKFVEERKEFKKMRKEELKKEKEMKN